MPLHSNITYQLPVMLPVPTVYGPKDYTEFRDTLIHMNTILEESGLEFELIYRDLEKRGIVDPTNFDIENRRKMIRCSILKVISGLDYRELSVRIAESELYQWFARYNTIGKIKTPSKSTIERFCKHFDADAIRNAVDSLNMFMSRNENAQRYFDVDQLHFDAIFADSTCVKAPIHFPVDWVLLRDCVRSLSKAILCIRRQGLKHRMPCPESFMSKINSLCIAMANSARKQDGKKRRKRILRKMKKLAQTIEAHGRRYHDQLSESWQQTDWTHKQAQLVLSRITNILDKLPQAIHQAHERIIGERKVASADKLLSMYEDDVHILIRGKSGANAEFGNGLYLAEQENGIIVDFEFFQDTPPHDSCIVKPSIARITKKFGCPFSYTGDRGFHNPDNSQYLEDNGILNGICPKSVAQMTDRLEEEEFCILQKRRAQTEARVGIYKNCFLGNPLRCKGYKSRHQFVALSVLVHNLWTYSVMARNVEYEKKKNAA